MKSDLLAIILIITGAVVITGEKRKEQIFDQLYILEGKWIMKTEKGAIGEYWTKINKDYLQNRGFMIRDSDTIITERVALRNTKEGIFYISAVEGQNNEQPVSFRLISADNNIFIFENPQHDYPKRISYSFVTKDSLYAWIDDGKKIPAKKSAFRYSRQN